jgi:hypothetical protein
MSVGPFVPARVTAPVADTIAWRTEGQRVRLAAQALTPECAVPAAPADVSDEVRNIVR